MSAVRSKALLVFFSGAAYVAAHGHSLGIVVNGVFYQGYDPTSFPYMQNPPTVAGWSTQQTDNGFIAPSAFADADIICHKQATNAGAHVVVAAGDKVSVMWNTWPESHKGPVVDYLASCGDSCETVNKTSLEFFKIDGVGLLDGSTAPGNWASDTLIANNNTWLVEIPPTIAPGNYVLRHEIIALHSAGQQDGAQAYPQCFNLQVTGGGSDVPAGVKGTELYGASDPGILINIYTTLSTYEVPGPTAISGAVSVDQATSAITATSTAPTGSGTVSLTATTTESTTTTVAASTDAGIVSSSAAVDDTTTAVASSSEAATTALASNIAAVTFSSSGLVTSTTTSTVPDTETGSASTSTVKTFTPSAQPHPTQQPGNGTDPFEGQPGGNGAGLPGTGTNTGCGENGHQGDGAGSFANHPGTAFNITLLNDHAFNSTYGEHGGNETRPHHFHHGHHGNGNGTNAFNGTNSLNDTRAGEGLGGGDRRLGDGDNGDERVEPTTVLKRMHGRDLGVN